MILASYLEKGKIKQYGYIGKSDKMKKFASPLCDEENKLLALKMILTEYDVITDLYADAKEEEPHTIKSNSFNLLLLYANRCQFVF